MSARVVAVSSSETPGIPKHNREAIALVANHGVDGDYHAGEFVRHRSRAAKDPRQPNRRQVHLIHSELFDELATAGVTVVPGAMGENITTRGLALLDIAPGTRLQIGATAVVKITGLRNPCATLNSIDDRVLQQVVEKLPDGSIVRKAGIMGVVVEGGDVRAVDGIRIEPPERAAALEPV